jgi:hypothetical protein
MAVGRLVAGAMLLPFTMAVRVVGALLAAA